MSDTLREVALIRQCVRLEDAVKRFELALDEARRAGRAEAFEMAAALASGDPRDPWEQQAMADHLRTLAKKERTP